MKKMVFLICLFTGMFSQAGNTLYTCSGICLSTFRWNSNHGAVADYCVGRSQYDDHYSKENDKVYADVNEAFEALKGSCGSGYRLVHNAYWKRNSISCWYQRGKGHKYSHPMERVIDATIQNSCNTLNLEPAKFEADDSDSLGADFEEGSAVDL